jgi:hypothetical protein
VELPILRRMTEADHRDRYRWATTVCSLAVFKAESDLPIGAEVTVELLPQVWSIWFFKPGVLTPLGGSMWGFELGVVPDIESELFTPIAEPVAFHLLPSEPDHLEAYRKLDGQLIIKRFDQCGNPVGDRELAAEASLEQGSGQVHIKDVRGFTGFSNALPVGMDDTPVFFGEFHWHCEFSNDGERKLEDALKSARDDFGLDFAGPADHISYPYACYRSEEFTPARQAEICRRFDEAGRFITLPGAELSGRFGHCNLHADSWETFLKLWPKIGEKLHAAWVKYPYGYPLRELAELGPKGRTLVIPHHTNTDSYISDGVNREDGLPFWCAMHYPVPPVYNALRLIEMNQGRGSYETEALDPKWHVRHGGFGGSVTTALTRGYRVGFVAGTDNHNGWPTRGHDGLPAGVTGVQADSLDLKSIFKALHDRRCYATTGARIVADATLNGYPIGSEQRLSPGAPRQFRISLRGTAPWECVQIIHCGAVLADFPIEKDTLDFAATYDDTRPGRPLEDAWYYIKARQTDGHCVWLSPFWVDLEG